MEDTAEVGKASDRTRSRDAAMDLSLDHSSNRSLQTSLFRSQSSWSPYELRQNILYKAFDMTELSDMVKQPGKKGEKLAAQTKVIERELRQRREKSLGIRMSQFESDSITMLHRRIGDFCCVSLLIQTDMEYVGKLWKRDLDE